MKYLKGIKRIICALLALVFVFGMVPVDAIVHASGEAIFGETVLKGKRDFKWPVPGYYNISGCFFDGSGHYALDIITNTTDADIVASYDGVVCEIVRDGENDGGYGNAIMVQHTYTSYTGEAVTLYTHYSHMSSFAEGIAVGTNVVGGVTVLGKTGGSGFGSATTYHVHLDFQILTSSEWEYKTQYSIDPYANNLLELPSGLKKGGTTDCCQQYIDAAKALYATSLHTHSYEKTVTPPTCTVDGYTTYTCSCGDKYIADKVTAPGHSYGTDFVCTACGEAEPLANGSCGDNLTWVLDKTGQLTVSGSGDMYDYYYSEAPWYNYKSNITSLVIKSGVTGICEYAFAECSALKKASLPDSLTTIGGYAFFFCETLSEINIPNSVTAIGEGALACCYALKEITLPNSVTSISDYLFQECNTLEEVAIPGSVTTIGDGAFEGCRSLKEITIPSSVSSLGHNVFSGCSSLTKITIPKGVEAIGVRMFSGCSALKEITIPSSVTAAGGDAFSGCSALTDVYFGGTAAQWDVVGMYRPEADFIHYSCASGEGHWRTVSSDATCTEAGYSYETCDCGYKKNEVNTEAPGHDYGEDFVCTVCGDVEQLDSGTHGANVKWVLYKNGKLVISGTGDMYDYGYEYIPWGSYRADITSVVIELGVTHIGKSAFYGCSALTEITIPDSVTSIGNAAFYGCSTLTEITIPDSVTSIGMSAFSDCSALTEITIPDSVTSIGGAAFAYCSSLTEITIPEGVTRIGSYAFRYCSALTKVTIPDSITHIDMAAFVDCSALTEIIIPDSVTSIGDYAFRGCSSLTEIIIPDSVTSIGGFAFHSCSALTEITIPDSVTSIGAYAFFNFDSLTDVYYGGTAEEWEDLGDNRPTAYYVHYSCASGEGHWREGSVSAICIVSCETCDCGYERNVVAAHSYGADFVCTVCGDVEQLDSGTHGANVKWVLYKNGKLVISGTGDMYDWGSEHIPWGSYRADITSVVIEPGVTHIGKSAFYGCEALKEVTIPDSVTSIGECAFMGCSALEEIIIPDSVTSIGDGAFYGCSSLTEIIIPDSVTSIGVCAFQTCSALTKITIPDSVTSIGAYAFADCTSLTEITIPDSVTSIGETAFEDCDSLTDVYYGGTTAEWTALGDACPDADYIHYSCESGENHWREVSADATCTEAGFSYETCDCGYKRNEVAGESALGHDMGEWDITDATCTVDGSKRRDCSRCDHYETEVITAQGHDYGADFVCTVCGDVDCIAKGECGDELTWLLYKTGELVISGTGKMSSYTEGGAPWYGNREKITAVTIKDGVSSVGAFAFTGCSALTKVTISKDVTAIGGSAFRGCKVMAEITLPEGVATIGNAAFAECTALAQINIPSSVTGISSYAFYGCRGLTEITIPDGVAAIDVSTFYNCSALKEITIPGSVTSIAASAFFGCSALNDVYYGGNAAEWIALGDVCPDADFIHYSCASGENHWREVSADATCTEAGSTYETCDCGYKRNEVAGESALGHDMGEWDITDEPTCTVDGSKRKDCSRCDHYETDVISAPGHDYGEDFTCSVCGDVEQIANGICGINLTWILYKTGELVISGTGDMYNYELHELPPWYENKDSISRVTINNGATSIGIYAFYNCTALVEIALPESLTSIGAAAFRGCGALEEITVPEKVGIIGDAAFRDCTALKKVTILGSLSSITGECFYNCSSLEEIIIPEGVTEIGISAFYNCASLKKASLPDGVNTIDYCAFYGCKALEEINIPESVTTIGDYAFYHCKSLKEIKLPEGLTKIGHSAFTGCSALTEIIIPEDISIIDEYVFYGCSSLKEIIISEGVAVIGNNAFCGCKALKEITIPKSVTTIGAGAFSEGVELTDVYYGGTSAEWTALGDNRPDADFIHYSCESGENHWREVSYDATCTEAGYSYETCDCGYKRNEVTTESALGHDMGEWDITDATCTVDGSKRRDCSRCDHYETDVISAPGHDYGADFVCTVCGDVDCIAKGECGDELTWILYKTGELVISGTGDMYDYDIFGSAPWYDICMEIKTVVIGDGVTNIGSYAFAWCNNLTEISIPESVSSIGDYALMECCLIEIDLSENITCIGDGAFRKCWEITSITLPDSITSISHELFDNCNNLISVTIPDSVTSIGERAFQSCMKLRSITLPDNVTSIGNNAFLWCTSLTEINIPSSVTSIGESAFSGCSALADVYYGGTAGEWTALGEYRPDAKYIHYSCTDGKNHWREVSKDPTCTEAGTSYDTCNCGYKKNVVETEAALGHDYGADFVCTVCGDIEQIDSGACGDNLTWVLYKTGKLVISGTGDMYDYGWGNIPWYDNIEDITSVILHEGVTSIGNYAFFGCSALTEITISDSVATIGDYAFVGCSALTEITIPDSVTSIGMCAFRGCKVMAEITLPEGVATIGNAAFAECTALAQINIPSSVTSIGDSAFYYCTSLTEINIPDSVTAIGDYAFLACSALTEITIPESVTSIDEDAFLHCDSLTDVYYGGTTEEWVALGDNRPEADFVHYSCESGENHWREVSYDATCTEAGYSYETCDCGYKRNEVTTESALGHDMGEWDITDATCTVDGSKRKDCSRCDHYETEVITAHGHDYGADFVCTVCGDVEQLANGTCGDNLTWVLYKNGKLVISGTGDMERYDSGAAPWYGYRKEITAVVIESGVTSISDSAFRNCNAMTEITISDSVTQIGYEVFYGCSALADVYITDPSAWCKITFSDRSSNPMDFAGALHVIDAQGNEVTEITLDESVTTIPYRAFYNCRGLKEITIPDSVIDIGDYAFGGCSALTEITIPESVTGIGDGAFSGCSALTEITILGNITELGSYVFYNCDALTEITIPDSVTEIGDLAFANSDALAEITIPDSVTSIGDWAFYSCDALTEITIPNSVTGIGDKAFSDCNSLSDVYYGGTSDEWTALGDNRPDADYIHYSCASGEDHWREVINGAICTEAGSSYETCDCGYKRNEVTTESGLGHNMGDWSITDEPTCTVDGSQRRDCSRCDHFETEVIPAGHDMGEWYTVTEATPETEGEDRRDCSRCEHYETRTTQFVDNMLKLEGNDFANKTTVYINGLPYPVVVKGDERYVELPTEEDCSIVTYDFHVGDPNDVHTQYPVSMKVYIVSDGKITYVKELDNLLQYSGSSIRITGKKGIRMITSLYQNTKSALTGKGLAGYKLVEYGTVLAFAHEVAGDGDLVLGKSYSRSNYAYKRGVSDPVFANKGNLTQYTNVLVGFNLDQCKEDIAMRPYIILENAKGEQFTIYGGTIYRSIGYVAYQNRNAVAPGTAAYSFVWDIIHHVYGNKYDKDYKG